MHQIQLLQALIDLAKRYKKHNSDAYPADAILMSC